MNNCFKILIISHNALSMNNNMGKTISSFIKSMDVSNVAQLYLRSGVPNCPNCSNYYQFTDEDALKSVLIRTIKGKIINKVFDPNLRVNLENNAIHEIGRKRHPYISFIRDVVWKLSNVNNHKLISWVTNFNPDIIFFAAGDYRFSYKLVRKIAKKINKPVATCFFDDFYFYSKYKNEFLGKIYYKLLRKEISKTINFSSVCFATNNEMSKKYTDEFKKNFPTLFTSCELNFKSVMYEDKMGINYLGGLGLGRNYQLKEIGETIYHNFGIKIGVYSNETNEQNINVLKETAGIEYHGCASSNDVLDIIAMSKAVLHVESFDEEITERTKYSLSTKIAESLSSGTLLIAYGPRTIASIKYLEEYNAALIADNIGELICKLKEVLNDGDKYNYIVNNAFNLYKKNHTPVKVSNVFFSEIKKALSLR